MWIRLRLDIDWRDLLLAFAYGLSLRKRSDQLALAKASWSSQNDFLITLSVRSGFDLLLRALQLPQRSEVLMSAVTVPDMHRIAQLHGLTPVPLDMDIERGRLTQTLEASITPRTRMIVVAHLFGERMPIDHLEAISKRHRILIVEDLAQGFRQVGEVGHPVADVSMFSFGPIKTATALGGAVIRVKDAQLRKRMLQLHGGIPIQSRTEFLRRVFRFALLKVLSGKTSSWLFKLAVENLGLDFDSLVNRMGRGFSNAHFVDQLRRRPSMPLLRLLTRRWSTYDFARIDRRRAMGRRVDMTLERRRHHLHTYWLYPVFSNQPILLRNSLRKAGYDATCQHRMALVPTSTGSDSPQLASRAWQNLVLIPWYPEMPDNAMDEMLAIVCDHSTSGPSSEPLEEGQGIEVRNK